MSVERFLAEYAVRPGLVGGLDPMPGAERQRRWRARRRGEWPAYPFLAAELAANAERTDAGCLEWMRARKANGYGVLSIDGRKVYAHRRSLELKLGRPILAGHLACHTCDNPPCIEPDHLFEGTPRDNTIDCRAKGRWRLGP